MQNDTEEELFTLIYTKDWSMIACLFASLINFVLITPLLYSIVWYEHYGTDYQRTLLNQLVSTTCWNGIIYNLFAIPAEVVLEIFGPFNKLFCHFLLVLKTSIVIHLLCMILFIVIVKYLYIFVFKNPLHF